jgi:uncharacterized membrane protein YuzA (DUF378 family)
MARKVRREGTAKMELQPRIRAESTGFRMKFLDIISKVLLVLGGLNWGLWGLFQYDVIASLLGGNTTLLGKAVYGLVGLAALYQVIGPKPIQMRSNAKPVSA